MLVYATYQYLYKASLNCEKLDFK